MTALADVAELLKEVRREADLSQQELARRAGVGRTTLARMETLANGDMSVSVGNPPVFSGRQKWS